MNVTLHTPTGRKTFVFSIDASTQRIHITTSSHNNTHDYDLRAIKDLYNWLRHEQNGEWVYLGSKGEEESPDPHTVEAWARDTNNPIGGFYGLTKGRKGRFASYIPSILEYLGLAEVEHKGKNNRMRAIP